MPDIMDNNVVFPHPDGPTSMVSCPKDKVVVMLKRTCNGPSAPSKHISMLSRLAAIDVVESELWDDPREEEGEVML
jgi:hypothetical protein